MISPFPPSPEMEMAIAAAPELGYTKDMLMEILSRLPVKTLLRFKSVCKFWYSLIQNPTFITLHHNRSNTCLFANRSRNFDFNDNVITVFSFIFNQTQVEDTHPSSLGLNFPLLNLVGPSINGVICFLSDSDSDSDSNSNSKIVLCNPSMREFRVLPQPPYETRRTSYLGFGFDPKTNDYQVIRVATLYESDVNPPPVDEWGYCEDEDAEFRTVDDKVHLYELGTDSWREIYDVVLPKDFRCEHFACTNSNGDFYWYATRLTGDRRITEKTIVVFRVNEEVFEQLPEPLPDHSWDSDPHLFVVKNSLGLVLSSSDFSVLDLWMLNEECGWTKAYTIGPLAGSYVALGFRQNGEFLMMKYDIRQMVSYNLDTQEIKEYQLYCIAPCPGLQVVEYTESLVSVKRRNGAEE